MKGFKVGGAGGRIAARELAGKPPRVTQPDVPVLVGGDWPMVRRVVHQFAHSRTPFSEAQVAELADCSRLTASVECDDAVRRHWIVPAATNRETRPGVGRPWRGVL